MSGASKETVKELSGEKTAGFLQVIQAKIRLHSFGQLDGRPGALQRRGKMRSRFSEGPSSRAGSFKAVHPEVGGSALG